MSKADDRKNTPIYQGVVSYFPEALKAIAKLSAQGNVQHGLEGEKLRWQKDISNDHEDALMRHLGDHSVSPLDDDGHLHLTKVAWRALAALQVYLERSKIQPAAPFEENDERMNIIGQNGNEGIHYTAEEMMAKSDEIRNQPNKEVKPGPPGHWGITSTLYPGDIIHTQYDTKKP